MSAAIINWPGAIVGLILAIILIFRKVNPVYALFGGAVVGGLLGGASLDQTVKIIIEGTNSVMGAVVRVIAAGVLAGILIESGAAEKIAETIVGKLGEKKALLAIVDSMIILPVAGIIGLIAMGQTKKIVAYTTSGLNKMTGTVIILIGAGAIAGIVSKSNLSTVVVDVIKAVGISGTFLAPIAGILMGAAMASTSTASIVAAGTFGNAILSMGVAPLSAAVMVHTGATVIDHLPHGNFFHVTGESVKMSIKERMKLIPYESIVGMTMTIAATIVYGLLR